MLIGIYVGILAVLLVSVFLISDRLPDFIKTNTGVLSSLRFVLAGGFMLLLACVVGAFSGRDVDAGFYEYAGRATQLMIQKFLFFNVDILAFYPLFDVFFWALLILGIYLVLTTTVIDLGAGLTRRAADLWLLLEIYAV